MSWKIPELKKTEHIPSLALSKWFVGFLFCLMVLVLVFLVMNYLVSDKNMLQYGVMASIVLFVLFGVAVGWNVLRISMLTERNELIELSNIKIENACRLWMSEYVRVLNYSYVLPEGLDIEKFRNGEEFNVIGDKSIKFSDEVNYIAIFQELLSPLRYQLLELSRKHDLEINFVVPEGLTLPLWTSFVLAWRNLQLDDFVTEKPVFVFNAFSEKVEEWIESQNERHRLAIVCHPLKSDDAEETTTDGACAWLLAPSMQETGCSESFRLYRALETDEYLLKKDLMSLIKYQDGFKNVGELFINNVSNKSIINEVAHQCNEFLRARNDNEEIHQSFTHLILGKQSHAGIWMMTTLIYFKYFGRESVNLMVSQDEGRLTLFQIRSLPANKEQS